jgi:hypothetical protein
VNSWMFSFLSDENFASFFANICLQCGRAWDDSLVNEAEPICQAHTVTYQKIVRHWNEGNPIEYDLPTWEPANCGAFIAK